MIDQKKEGLKLSGWTSGPVRFALLAATVSIVIAAASEVGLFLTARTVLRHTVDDELVSIARVAAGRLDVAKHATLTRPEQLNGPEYAEVVRPFREIAAALPAVRFIYTVRSTPEGIRFGVDAALPIDSDKDGVIDQSALGEAYPAPDPAMLEAFSSGRLTVSAKPYKDKWGSFISAYHPVTNADGKAECVIGVDVNAKDYMTRVAKMEDALFMGLLIAVVGGLGIGFAMFFIQRRRLQAEEHLRINEYRFHGFFETGMVGMAIQTPSRGWIEANECLCRILGLTREGLMERSWSDLIHPDDRVAEGEAFKGFATGGVLDRSCEIRLLAADGRVIQAEVSIRAVRNAEGAVDHLVMLVADITARKLADERLRQSLALGEALLAASEIVSAHPAMADGDVHVISGLAADQAAMALQLPRVSIWSRHEGQENFHALFSLDRSDVASPSHFDCLPAAFRRHVPALEQEGCVLDEFACGASSSSLLVVGMRTAGLLAGVLCLEKARGESWEPKEISFARQLADQLGITMLNRDRRVAAMDLVAARDAADTANRAKSEFLAAMSHEIRTPMNGVLGFIQLLLDSPLSDEQRVHATTIQNSAESLMTVINDILDFSKIEAGRLEVDHVPYDARPVVEDALDIVAQRAAEKGLDLVLDWPDSIPSILVGDDTRLRQIVINLVGNAVKFTGRGHVMVKAERVDGMSVRISVTDTGVGISPEVQKKLFLHYTQADASTTRKYGGTGLGLAICRQLVGLLGGQIGVSSEERSGSTFWFTHPIAPEARSSESSSAMVSRETRVLVVHPSSAVRDAIVRRLEDRRIRGETAHSPAVAMERVRRAGLEKSPFDAVFVAQRFPGIEWDEIGRQIRADATVGRPALFVLAAPMSVIEPDLLSRSGFCHSMGAPFVKHQSLEEALRILRSEMGLVESTSKPVIEADDKPAGPTAPASGIERRVMVVDDNPVNRDLAQELLERVGWSVDSASNGREATQLALAKNYDLILMDCHMPTMDGYEAARLIRDRERSEKRRTPIVALTADAQSTTRKACLDAGMDDFLTKPVTPATLRQVVERWARPE